MKNQMSYIPSLEAKDIVNSQKYKKGFETKGKEKWVFNGTLDYSLDSIKIDELDKKAFYLKGDKQFTKAVVNVNFNYSINSIRLRNKRKIFEKKYNKVKNLNIVKYPFKKMTTKDLRTKLYTDGFKLDNKQYVRFKRSSGSSRVGKCLFIRKDLYNKIMKWSYMGLEYEKGEKMDLASMEAYISLTTSSIIGTLEIDPKSILLIEDYESVFKDEVMATEWDSINKRLVTSPKESEIYNSIFDGQSLLDISVFGEYQDKGFILARNRFFKSACFNSNIQQFFKDNNITKIEQLNGITLAEKIEDIKMITTPSSIKYLKMAKQHKMFKVDGKYDKFKAFKYWIENVESMFGVVKYEKPPHNMHEMVSCHYQLLNTLPLNKDDIRELMQPTLDYIKLLKDDVSVLRYHMGMKCEVEDDCEDNENFEEKTLDINNIDFTDSNRLIYDLLKINDDFANTKVVKKFKHNLITCYKDNLREGHILLNGNYSVLCGNGYEMLLHSIGKFNGKSVLGIDEVHNYTFDYNKEIIGIRSPHVTMGNVWVCKNVECKELDRYFNSTKFIIHVNSINNNLLQILSGCDFDSDQILITDNNVLVKSAKKIYGKFLAPNDFTPKKTVDRTNSIEDKIDLDIKTSKNLIGEIINLSQILNSEYWDRMSKGLDANGLYELIAQLDVMSCIEIDKAKKESVVDSAKELKEIRKSKWISYGIISRNKQKKEVMCRPYFFKYVGVGKDYKFIKKNTPMDFLQEVIDEEIPRAERGSSPVNFLDLIVNENVKKANREKVNKILSSIEVLNNEINSLFKINIEYDDRRKIIFEKRQKLVTKLSKISIGKLELLTILKRVNSEKKDKYDNLKKSGLLILNILFNSYKEEFLNILLDNSENVQYLKEDVYGEIKIFYKNFTKNL